MQVDILIGIGTTGDGGWKAALRVNGAEHLGPSTYATAPEAIAAVNDVIELANLIVTTLTGHVPMMTRHIDN